MKPFLLLAIAWLSVPTGLAAPFDDRMRLTEAIDTVRALGFEISYSSRLVREWMRVRSTPQDDDPLRALDSALDAYGLALSPGPSGTWLVVRDQPAPPPAAPDTRELRTAATDSSGPPPIDEITIVASRYGLFEQRGASDQFLTGDEIGEMPHIADDAFRAFHRLPGAAASDFRAPFNLRGGALDEVKTEIDGLELIEPYHMRTLFSPLSIIDPGTIGEAEVLSGGFTVEHGNYMSGVIAIETARPDSAPVHEFGVSFVSAIARSKGRILDDRGGYFFAARRGYLDLIAEQVVDDDEELTPRYQDLFASMSYAVGDDLQLSLRTLLADDDVTFIDPADGEDFREDSSIRYLWLAADYESASGIRSRTTAFAGRVKTREDGFQTNPPAEQIARRYARDIEVNGLRSDWSATVGDRHVLRSGLRARQLATAFDYRLDSVRRSDFVNSGAPFSVQRDIDTRRAGEDYYAYVAWRSRLSDRLVTEAGLRWDRQTYTDDDRQVAPRFNLFYELGDRTELRAAWGRYHQPQAIQDLPVPDGDLAYRPAEEVEHRIVGLSHTFSSGMAVHADVYDKRYLEPGARYENLLDIYEFAPESNFDRVRIDPDKGRAYGAEVTLRKRQTSRLSWWLNYTWSKATDTLDGETVPRSWDQRHAVTASASWRSDWWSLSVVARYHSGWPRTPLVAMPIVDSGGNIVGIDTDLTQRNGDAFDDYSRIDVRLSRRIAFSRSNLELYFEIFNLFDTVNQCCTSNHVLTIGQGVTVSPQFDDFLPLFPSFGFVWQFGPGAR